MRVSQNPQQWELVLKWSLEPRLLDEGLTTEELAVTRLFWYGDSSEEEVKIRERMIEHNRKVVRETLEERNINARELAEMLGMSQNYFYEMFRKNSLFGTTNGRKVERLTGKKVYVRGDYETCRQM